MLTNHIILAFLLMQAVCEGFDFTFQPSALDGSPNVMPGQSCGVVTCRETVAAAGDPAETRKLSGLAIYRRSSSDGSGGEQWEEIASVTSQDPSENKVTDAKHITGQLSDTTAYITMDLLKSNDCALAEFMCVVTFVSDNERTTLIKSVVGGKTGSGGQNQDECSRNTVKMANNQFGIERKMESYMAMLSEKLQCVEKRIGDSLGRSDKLEDTLDSLKDKFNSLERTVSDKIDSSSERVRDKMDRMKDRLEDKIAEISVRNASPRVEGECFVDIASNVSSQLAALETSISSVDTSVNSIGDQVNDIKSSMLKSTAVNNQLQSIAAGVAGISALSNNLTTSVNDLGVRCADKTADQVGEFFDALGTGKKEWRLAFRGTAYNNVEVYPAYLYGSGIPADVEVGCKQFNHSLPCSNHYRNRDALENWGNVDQVLFALYVKGQMVQNIKFNGRDSTFVDWFAGSKVLSSSWTDLKPQTHNMFSIQGDARTDLLRRFIVHHLYSGCAGDIGWFVAGDALPGGCPWEKKVARPAFIYAKGNVKTLWASGNFATADAMGIFVKYQ